MPIRWIIVRDPTGAFKPQGFLATNPIVTPEAMLGWFASRWQVEVTFEEVRVRLGVETQRQWSDLAIARTTPALLGLFSLVVLWMNNLAATERIAPQATAWCRKPVSPSPTPSPPSAVRSGTTRLSRYPRLT